MISIIDKEEVFPAIVYLLERLTSLLLVGRMGVFSCLALYREDLMDSRLGSCASTSAESSLQPHSFPLKWLLLGNHPCGFGISKI